MLQRRLALLGLVVSLAAAAPKPKLVLGIVIDQFRADYLTRFRGDYDAGFDRLLKDGAVFTHANLIHCPTVTAIGHSTFLTGATPSRSGIAGNEWYDRAAGKLVTSVSDDDTKLLGDGDKPGASPRRLLVDTLGDNMKKAWGGKTRVIGISLKDRSAILTSGHKADGAYWFDPGAGNFVSSTYYFPRLPAWVTQFNQARPADRYAGEEWIPLLRSEQRFLRKMPATPGPALYRAIDASPYGNELIEAFAEHAMEAERLGQHEATDLVAISFSSNDYVGHVVGPDAPEVRDISIRTDRLLGRLFQFVDAKVGLENVLVVLTSDHGVAPLPGIKGGRVDVKTVAAAAQDALAKKFGSGNWVLQNLYGSIYLNRDLARQKHLDEAAVEQVAAEGLRAVPHVMRVYTREQILKGQLERDHAGRLVKNGFYPERSADLIVLFEPYWIPIPKGASHGSVNEYDTHVPVIFMGPEIKPGTYGEPIAPNDIAPTLASILGAGKLDGSAGRVLHEIVK